MGLMSVSIENPYFMTMVITMLGFILRSSPQLLIMRFDDGEGNIKQQMLLLKILEGSVLFSQIIIVLIFIGIIVSQYVILRFFRGLIVGQIMIKLLFPFQVYLALSLFNQRSQNQSNSGYLVIMILSAIIVQSITTIFQYRFHSGKYTKNLSINKIYERLWQVNLLLPAFASLFISNHYQLTIILIILILLNALKSTLFSCQIIYQTPVLQYCGYIGQFCSWMTIIQLSMFIFFDINPFTLQCINLIIVFCLIFKPHKQLIALMEVKYMRQFKKQESFQNSIQNSILNLNSNTSSEKSMYTLMKKISTVVFVQGELQMAKNSLMDRSNIVQQERPFFNFSQSFMHEIKQSKYMNEHKQNLNLDNEENQQQYLNIWYYIENNPILLTKRFYNFQRFLIYCLPVQNNLSHLRLVQLFYSWFNQMEDEVFTSTQHSNSFRQIIHRRLDYMFLRERIDSQFTFEKKFIQNGIDTKRQIMQDNQKKIFCLSFKQEKFFNWKFQQSFDQAEFQERIHKEMSVFIQTQEQLINLLTCTQIKKKFKIFSQLIQRSDKKNRIFSIFDEYNISRRSIKCTIYEYMITKFILKLPRLATRELRQRMEIITRDSVQLLDEDKTKFNVIISGMREKGYIIHTCSMFKQKMEIKQQREDYKESKRIHINDLMMKFYSQKHLEALEGLNYMSESMRKFHNTRRKGLFMASLVTQRLYQVSFTINFMTRSMHDIYLVMDMTYKEVGSLTVYKNDIKVFQKKSPVVIIKSQPSISTSSRSSFQPREKSKIISANEKIFDESYLFEFEYIDSTQLQEDTERKSSNQKYIEQEQFQARLLQTKEKDLQSYRNQTYFNQGYWTIFTILMFLIPIVLTLMTYILANLAAQNQQQNKNFYMTNYNVQNQFFLTDLKSFNIFFVFNIFKAPYILFENMRQRVAFFDSWKFQLDEELNNIHSRGIKVVEDILRPNTMTPFLFAPLSETQTSFLFRKQRYDGQITDILHSFGNISTIKQFQNTGSISKKIPNQGEFYQLERFYNFNLHLFEKYTKPESGIFPKINILVHDSLENQRMLFGNISIGIILLWVIGGILFVFIFIKLKYRVLDMVSKSFIFNQSNFKMMIERLAQFKQLLKTSERSSSCTLVNKIGIASNKKVSDDSRVLSNTAFKRSDNFQQPKMNVLKHSWPQILIFLLIVFGFSMIIYSFNNDSASEIHLMEKYLSGTQQLVEVTGKTLYLFNCLIDSLLSPNPINPLIPTYIEQVISVDRAAILRKLFPSQQTLHNITFNPMCLQHEEMNCYKDQYVRQNYMQTMGRIIHLSSGLYKTMLKAGKYGNINEEPILQLYSQVNLMTKMIRQILYDIEVNFISELQNMTVYIYYVCAYLILYCLVIAWWTWTQTYTKNKIYSIQVLSLVSYQEMIRISDFHFYLHDIQNQQWVENHDHY